MESSFLNGKIGLLLMLFTVVLGGLAGIVHFLKGLGLGDLIRKLSGYANI